MRLQTHGATNRGSPPKCHRKSIIILKVSPSPRQWGTALSLIADECGAVYRCGARGSVGCVIKLLRRTGLGVRSRNRTGLSARDK